VPRFLKLRSAPVRYFWASWRITPKISLVGYLLLQAFGELTLAILQLFCRRAIPLQRLGELLA
jgi:hypothetical protein